MPTPVKKKSQKKTASNTRIKVPRSFLYSTFGDYSALLELSTNFVLDSSKVIVVRGLLKQVLDFVFARRNQALTYQDVEEFLRQKYSFSGQNLETYLDRVMDLFDHKKRKLGPDFPVSSRPQAAKKKVTGKKIKKK